MTKRPKPPSKADQLRALREAQADRKPDAFGRVRWKADLHRDRRNRKPQVTLPRTKQMEDT